MIKQPTYFNKKGENRVTIEHIAIVTQSLKCEGRKNGAVDAVGRINKLRYYSNMPNHSHAIFGLHKSTLDVHPKTQLW